MREIAIARYLSSKNPGLRYDLRRAEIRKTPEEFIRDALKQVGTYTLMIAAGLFMLLDKMDMLFILPFAVLFFAMMFYGALMGVPKAKVKKIAKDIDREILFAGRFLLVKIHAGRPLLNALMDASRSYGVSSKYFGKIINDINTGTPIEAAIEKEMNSSPSEKFQKILFQVNNALKLGIDVSGPLGLILEEIANEQKVEIMKYGKKLNSVIMFYMLAAIVVPSLGITMLAIVFGLISIPIDATVFIAAVGVLAFVQLAFISVFRSIRPTVNL